MARFPCPFGHTEEKGGKLVPLVHLSKNRCAIYRALRSEGRIDFAGNYLPGKGPDSGSQTAKAPPPAGQDAGEKAGAGAPAPAPAKETIGAKVKRYASGLTVKYRQVETAAPLGPGAEAQNQDWEISNETSVRFWATIFGFIQQIVNLICAFLEIPKMPDEVFTVDPGQEFVFRTALKGFTTQILKKVFLAKSPEDADRIVAGLSGVLGFGMMGMKIAIHFFIHVPKSPRLAGWRERRARVREERRLRHEAQDAARAAAAPPGRPA